jgi:hypothetical protein
MNAGLEKGVGRAGVHVIGRDDGDGLDSVLALGFGFRHGFEIVVDAVGGQAERGARTPRFLSGRGKRPGHEFVMIVHARGEPMHGADEGALAAADHAEANLAAFVRIAASFDSHIVSP